MRMAAIVPAFFLTLLATVPVRPLEAAESEPGILPVPAATAEESLSPSDLPDLSDSDAWLHLDCDSPEPCACRDYVSVCQHRSGVFLEGLLLRPGSTDLVYAVEHTGCDPAFSSPTGPVGVIAADFGGGVRGGITWAFDESSSVVATYTRFETDVEGRLAATPGHVLVSQVTHPSQASCGSNSLASQASQSLEFQLVDLDYRQLLWGDCDAAINWLAGLRYAQLEQRFWGSQNTGVATGLTDVATDIDFDGLGLRFGLDGERRNPNCGLLIYAKGFANLVAGEFKADYSQVSQFGATAVVANHLEDYRLVSQLEAELGVGWQSDCGRHRLTVGYLASGWLNAVTTDAYVQSVRSGQQSDVGDSLSFSGLAVRLEVRH